MPNWKILSYESSNWALDASDRLVISRMLSAMPLVKIEIANHSQISQCVVNKSSGFELLGIKRSVYFDNEQNKDLVISPSKIFAGASVGTWDAKRVKIPTGAFGNAPVGGKLTIGNVDWNSQDANGLLGVYGGFIAIRAFYGEHPHSDVPRRDNVERYPLLVIPAASATTWREIICGRDQWELTAFGDWTGINWTLYGCTESYGLQTRTSLATGAGTVPAYEGDRGFDALELDTDRGAGSVERLIHFTARDS